MANTILHKRSSVSGKVPLTTDLQDGELALNTADGIVYFKDSSGAVIDPAAIRYTDAEKSKLAGIEAGAQVNPTAAEIKTAYESNPDTNAYTDAEKSKLAGIEAGATGDQTAGEILSLLLTVDGPGSGLDADTLDGTSSSGFIKTDGTSTVTANISLNGNRLTNVADGIDVSDVVTKQQLDSAQAGLLTKQQCRVATTTALPAVTASGSGVGKTLTANSPGVLTVDGINTVLGDRILVKDQANAVDNGIYEVTVEGNSSTAFVLTRASDFDGNPSGEVKAGVFTFINEGNDLGKSGWTLLDTGLTGGGSPVVAVVDTDPLTFTQFQGLPQYIAGNQLTLTGQTFDVVEGPGSGLDADTVDGIQAASFLRSDTTDTHSGSITPNVDNTINLGSATKRYTGIYAVTFYGEATTAQYADLAEIYVADENIEPGTVVSFGGSAEVTRCLIDMDTRVAGVVSTNPAYLMNSNADGIPVALQGRVPCKVSGTIKKGDMLVADGKGGARAEENPKIGSVIGKALEDSEGDAVIEVVVGRL